MMKSPHALLITMLLATPWVYAKDTACAALGAPARAYDMQVPFKVIDGRIYVDAKVNGMGPYAFAIDTGASGLARADTSLVNTLKLKLDPPELNSDGLNTSPVDTTHLKSLSIGRFTRNNLQVITRDYNSKMKPEAALSGIVAREFFADGLLVIDYPHKTLSFSKALKLAADSVGTLAYEKPFRVPVTVGTIATQGNLDTGANVAFVLPLTLFNQVGGAALTSAGTGQLANTQISTSRATLHGPFKIGNVELADQDVRVSEKYPELLVGAHALQHFTVLIDQRSKRVALCETPQ